MEFTIEEITKLKTKYPNADKYGVHNTTNQGFGYTSITKNGDGQIVYYWHYPASVDPDDGTINWYDDGGYIYNSIEDLLNNKIKSEF